MVSNPGSETTSVKLPGMRRHKLEAAIAAGVATARDRAAGVDEVHLGARHNGACGIGDHAVYRGRGRRGRGCRT